jgi:hypothetical protein
MVDLGKGERETEGEWEDESVGGWECGRKS